MALLDLDGAAAVARAEATTARLSRRGRPRRRHLTVRVLKARDLPDDEFRAFLPEAMR